MSGDVVQVARWLCSTEWSWTPGDMDAALSGLGALAGAASDEQDWPADAARWRDPAGRRVQVFHACEHRGPMVRVQLESHDVEELEEAERDQVLEAMDAGFDAAVGS